MPTYDYHCEDCHKRSSIYQTYEQYGVDPVLCRHCGGSRLKRIIGRVRFARSADSRLDDLSDPASWDGFDEEDPRAMARMMRRMGQELGEDIPPEFDEIVDRLESGEDPEQIEKDLPEYSDGADFDLGD
jgi:putative FmdB family regulatory protein